MKIRKHSETVGRDGRGDSPRSNQDPIGSSNGGFELNDPFDIDFYRDFSGYGSGSSSNRETTSGSTDTAVFGDGKHSGKFNRNNPYYQQLVGATNQQDRDALYERAIEWEADYYNLTEQRAYNEQVLAEQREYDSPIQQLIRNRQAGINSDIPGASSSGSLSSGSSAQMKDVNIADQAGQTKFSNRYDDINNVYNGINTACNVVSTFVGGFGTIANTISQFRLLPSQIGLNESQATLNTANANEINQLLDGKKKRIDLGNSLQYIDMVGQLSNLVKTDATDEEMAAFVASAGIEEAQQPNVISAIREAQKHPEFLSNYKNSILSDRKAEAALQVYSTQAFQDIMQEELELQELSLDFAIMKQSLSNKVQTFLNNSPGYAEDLADVQTGAAYLGAEQMTLAKDQFRRDLAAYQHSLDNIVAGYKSLEARNAELDQIREKRALHPVEQLEYDSNLLRMNKLYSLGSQEVGQVYSIINDANRQRFYLDANSDFDKEKGHFRALGGGTQLSDDVLIYGQIAFGDVLKGQYTSQELAQQWSKIILEGISTGAQIYMGYRIGQAAAGTKVSHNYKVPGADGGTIDVQSPKPLMYDAYGNLQW